MHNADDSIITDPGTVNKNIFEKKTIIKGALWFILITIITIAGIFFYSNTGQTLKAISSISIRFVLICLLMLFADLILGAWRNHIFIQKLNPGTSFWVSFKANVANMFMGAITPAHGGAGPAQIYVYSRFGVSVINSFTVSLINMGATLIFMPLAGFVALLVLDNDNLNGLVPSLLKYGFSIFLLVLLLFLLAFWKPLWVGEACRKIAAGFGKMFPSKKEKFFNWGEKSYANINKYNKTSSSIIKQYPHLFPLSLLITFVLYLNKYCMQYFILLGLGVHSNITEVIAFQVLIQFMIYFAPSPGGSGFAEVSISVLFGKIVPANLLAVFTVLQRSFLLFFPAIIGAVVVINLLKNQAEHVDDQTLITGKNTE